MIIPEWKNDAWHVSGGLTRAGTDNARLGTMLFRIAPHWVAFDDAFAFPVMRAVFDPAFLKKDKAYDHLGYVQLVQFNFDGSPIPPWVFTPRLKDREPYLVDDKTLRFVDMMGPADLQANRVSDAFYALNGVLRHYTADPADFYRHPRPNGSLARRDADPPEEGLPGDESLFATITADVCAELLTPKDIRDLIQGEEPYATVTGALDEEPYRIVIAKLGLNTPPEATPQYLGTDAVEDGTVAVRVVGGYVVLALPDHEDFGPRLIVPPVTRSTDADPIDVYRVSSYDFEAAEYRSVVDMLQRVATYQVKNKTAKHLAPRKPVGRGRGGLDRSPYLLYPAEFAVEIVYTTILAGKPQQETRRSHLTPISAFTWSVIMQYMDDSRTLETTAVREPRLDLSDVPLDTIGQRMTELSTKKEYERAVIDLSYFTMAAVRRDNFAADRRLRYLVHTATDGTADDAVGYIPPPPPPPASEEPEVGP